MDAVSEPNTPLREVVIHEARCVSVSLTSERRHEGGLFAGSSKFLLVASRLWEGVRGLERFVLAK